MLLSSLLPAALLLQAASAPAAPLPTAVSQVRAVRATAPVVLDGDLAEPVWQGAHVVGTFLQRDPDEGRPASERSEVYLAYDDEALYVAARLHDSHPDSIIARLARRDQATSADAFYIFLDPYRDRRTGVYFAVNAAGTQYDGVLKNDDWDDDSWDAVWESRTRIDDRGWSVEVRIPYSQLRFRGADRHVWGVNFKRVIARKNETDYLVYTPRNASGFVSRFPDLVGIENVRPSQRLEILPYVTSKAEMLSRDPGDPFRDGTGLTGGVGADLKVGLGSNLTLDGTVNPDFGQVEVDPAVVNLSDVETFYPEKRPFFLEGSSIFEFGFGGSNSHWGFNFGTPEFFYSRRVGRAPQGSLPDADHTRAPTGTTILGAAKLTGKVDGATSFGAMHALTGREHASLSTAGARSRAEVEPLTYYGVLRGQREFGEGRRGLGLIATATHRFFRDDRLRDELNGTALATGADGWTFLDRDRKWVVTGWAGLSHVRGTETRITALQGGSLHYFQRPDARHVELDSGATALTGYAGRVALNKQKGNWMLNSAVGLVSPGFDINDLGFQWQADVVNAHAVGGYRWTTPGRVFRHVTTNTALFRSWNFDGDVTWTGVYHQTTGQFLNYYGFGYFVAYNPRTVSMRRTRGGPLTANPPGVEWDTFVESDDRKPLVFGLQFHGNHYAEESEWSFSVSPSVEWKPSSSVSLRLAPTLQQSHTGAQYVGTFEDPTAAATYGARYVFADLEQTELAASVRLNWIFTPKLSFELYAQPLISAGNYSNYKELARPRSYSFREYGRDGSTFSEVHAAGSNESNETVYQADPDGGGPAAPFEFDNPDFNFKSLRGNAVLRWEYLPGSTLYVVWTQNRTDSETIGAFRFGRSMDRLLGADADNVFAVKLTYWWNP